MHLTNRFISIWIVIQQDKNAYKKHWQLIKKNLLTKEAYTKIIKI